MSRLAVLGPGGVGGFLAAALADVGEDVTVVAREATAAHIAARGIELRSATLGEIHAWPRAVSELTEPSDVLFVTTKATALTDALTRVAIEPGIVIPLLNGLDHLELLRRRFDARRVAAATIRIDSDRPAPGIVTHGSPSVRIELAADDPELAARLPPLASTLERAGIPTRVEDAERQILWSKLLRLNALASTTSATGRPIGEIRSDPEWRPRLLACIEETAAVANADGASLDPADTVAELDAAHPGLGSSMLRDLQAGREPELDAIQGSVLRAAARHGLSCPTVAELTGQIAARSQQRLSGGAVLRDQPLRHPSL